MLSSSNHNLRVKAFKKAQDGDGYIIRVHDLSGNGAKGQIRFFSDILDVCEANGIEEKTAQASFAGKELNVDAARFGIKTYRVKLSKPSVDITDAEYETVYPPFNAIGITTDSFRSLGQIGANESYAAEVIPDNFSYRGIPFRFGKADFNNAVKCNGQAVNVPAGSKELHLLVASVPDAGKDSVTATFKIGDRTITREISAYNGFYGVYGWPGYYESKLRKDDVAYIGSHTHNAHTGNKAYEFSYMYLVSLPVSGATQVILPKGNVVLFSVTAEK